MIPYLRLALAGGLFAAGAVAGWWVMDGRVERARTEMLTERGARMQRDEIIAQLRQANSDMQRALETQNTSIVQLAREAQQRQDAAVAALEAARTSNHATARTIAALTARIKSGVGDCTSAVAEIRAGL